MSLLTEYPRQCKDTVGRLKRVYLAEFVDYDENEIVIVDGSLYTFPDTIIYPYECEGNYTQGTGTEGGDYYWDQEIKILLNKVYGVVNQRVYTKTRYRVIAETNNGIYLMFGVMNGLNCELSNSSGSEKPDFNGFELKFKGKEDEAAMPVDISGFHQELSGLYFNYDLSFGSEEEELPGPG